MLCKLRFVEAEQCYFFSLLSAELQWEAAPAEAEWTHDYA